jgi:2,4-dienoyl-CoA reductase-like NADH-dependent reductase (Old Yellow Enzyme family)
MIFEKLKIGKIYLGNKIVVSAMCQYSAKKGCPTEWHYSHLGSLAASGAGMLTIESTAVNMKGRITHADLCLQSNKQFLEMKKLFLFLKNISNIPICLQIAHAGRKGSSHIPWVKNNSPLKKNQSSWKTFSASSIKKDVGWPCPEELTQKHIKDIIKDYAHTIKLAKKIGFEAIEIHMAHGYLLHQFISPISNKRSDIFGGNLENRLRLPKLIIKEAKKYWPKNKILGARITATDHLQGGIVIKEAIQFVKQIEKMGINYICVSSGGILTKTNLNPNKKAFRLKMAEKIKKKTNVLVRVSGNLNHPKLLKKIIGKKIDFVALGRAFLKNPRWIFNSFKIKNYPNQISRGFKK